MILSFSYTIVLKCVRCCLFMSDFKLTCPLSNLFTTIFSTTISVKSFDILIVLVKNELFPVHQSLCYITLLFEKSHLCYSSYMSIIKYLTLFNNSVGNSLHKSKYIHSNSFTTQYTTTFKISFLCVFSLIHISQVDSCLLVKLSILVAKLYHIRVYFV
jgi:hypothetical protein